MASFKVLGLAVAAMATVLSVGGSSDAAANRSATIKGDHYKIDATLAGPCKANSECKLDIKIEALGEYHINKEFPHSFKSGGATTLVGAPAWSPAEKTGTMKVSFKTSEDAVKGTFKFAVCAASKCEPGSADISVSLK